LTGFVIFSVESTAFRSGLRNLPQTIKTTDSQLTYRSRVGTPTSFDKVFNICLGKLLVLLGNVGKLGFT